METPALEEVSLDLEPDSSCSSTQPEPQMVVSSMPVSMVLLTTSSMMEELAEQAPLVEVVVEVMEVEVEVMEVEVEVMVEVEGMVEEMKVVVVVEQAMEEREEAVVAGSSSLVPRTTLSPPSSPAPSSMCPTSIPSQRCCRRDRSRSLLLPISSTSSLDRPSSIGSRPSRRSMCRAHQRSRVHCAEEQETSCSCRESRS